MICALFAASPMTARGSSDATTATQPPSQAARLIDRDLNTDPILLQREVRQGLRCQPPRALRNLTHCRAEAYIKRLGFVGMADGQFNLVLAQACGYKTKQILEAFSRGRTVLDLRRQFSLPVLRTRTQDLQLPHRAVNQCQVHG